MNWLRWLFRRGEIQTSPEKDADLVDAKERLNRLVDKERRLKRLELDVQVKRRNPL